MRSKDAENTMMMVLTARRIQNVKVKLHLHSWLLGLQKCPHSPSMDQKW